MTAQRVIATAYRDGRVHFVIALLHVHQLAKMEEYVNVEFASVLQIGLDLWIALAKHLLGHVSEELVNTTAPLEIVSVNLDGLVPCVIVTKIVRMDVQEKGSVNATEPANVNQTLWGVQTVPVRCIYISCHDL
jgi:hypothetical protein